MTKRRKAPAMPAVQTRAEAIDLLGRYAQLQADIDGTTARTEAAIASLKTQRDGLNEPKLAEQQGIIARLQPWWEANRAAIAGDRRSVEIGGCQIGHRLAPPSLGFPKPEGTAVALLVGAGWHGLLRVKLELDKPAIMTAIRLLGVGLVPEDEDIVRARRLLTEWGFRITQKNEFFIEPASLPASAASDERAAA